MNLYFRGGSHHRSATAALYISFVVVVLVALSKVVLDPWLEVRGLEEQARQLGGGERRPFAPAEGFQQSAGGISASLSTEEEQAQRGYFGESCS